MLQQRTGWTTVGLAHCYTTYDYDVLRLTIMTRSVLKVFSGTDLALGGFMFMYKLSAEREEFGCGSCGRLRSMSWDRQDSA